MQTKSGGHKKLNSTLFNGHAVSHQKHEVLKLRMEVVRKR